MDENRSDRAVLLINRYHNNWKHFSDFICHHHKATANRNKSLRNEPCRSWLACWHFCDAASCFSKLGRWVSNISERLGRKLQHWPSKPSRTRFLSVYSGSWPLGWVFCEIWISLDVLLCTASILSLCAISIDRWVCRNGNVIHNGAHFESFLWLILPLTRHCCQRELIKRCKAAIRSWVVYGLSR